MEFVYVGRRGKKYEILDTKARVTYLCSTWVKTKRWLEELNDYKAKG